MPSDDNFKQRLNQAATYIQANPSKTLAILENLFRLESVLLTSDMLDFLEKSLNIGQSSVAKYLASQLFKITLPTNSQFSQIQLIKNIIHFDTSFETVESILIWHKPIINNEHFYSKIKISNKAEAQIIQEALEDTIKNPLTGNYEFCNILLALCINSPENIDLILPFLKLVTTKINVDKLIKYLIENNLGLETLYNYLPLIGRLSPDSISIPVYLIQGYPQKSLDAVLSYLEGHEFKGYGHRDALEKLASKITLKELPQFINRVIEIDNQKKLSFNIVRELVSNSQISVGNIFSSKVSPTLYYSAIEHLDYLFEKLGPSNSLDKFETILMVIDDNLYQSLDKSLIRNIFKAMDTLVLSPKQSNLYLYFIYKTDFNKLPAMYDVTAKLIHQPVNPLICDEVLKKCIQNKSFEPFSNGFVVFLLNYIEPDLFKKFVKKIIKPMLVHKKYDYQRLLETLAIEDPQNFHFLFIRNCKKLTKGFGKFDSTINNAKAICWSKCSIKEKILCFFSL